MTSPDPADPPHGRRGLVAGAAVVVVIAAAAVTVGIGVLRGAGTAAPEVVITPTGRATDAAAVYVHVSGAVRVPGLYRVAPGSRLVDVVAAAGGLAEDAAREGVNLARIVADGEQVVVPRVGDSPASGAGSAAPASNGKVNLNTADEAALDTLPRIGPALAQRILHWRTQNGRFTSVEDLLAVPGIGAKMLESLRDLVTV